MSSKVLSSSMLFAAICSLIDLGDKRLDRRLLNTSDDCLQGARSSLSSLFGRKDKSGKNDTK